MRAGDIFVQDVVRVDDTKKPQPLMAMNTPVRQVLYTRPSIRALVIARYIVCPPSHATLQILRPCSSTVIVRTTVKCHVPPISAINDKTATLVHQRETVMQRRCVPKCIKLVTRTGTFLSSASAGLVVHTKLLSVATVIRLTRLHTRIALPSVPTST